MKLRIFEQEQEKVKRRLTIAVVTALSAITSFSCSQNQDVLVTEIGVSPPSSRIAQTSPAGNLYVQGKNQHFQGDLQGAIATYTKVIDVDPNYATAYKSRGLAYF
ncbi:tetratricopeptide repeat protein, partial [Nodularia spumigena]